MASGKKSVRLPNGPKLSYVVQGDQSGAPVLFLHAYADSWFSYSRVLSLLSPEYRAFAPDQRGHGDSTPTSPSAATRRRTSQPT